MSTDPHDFWCTALQVNTNHTGKLLTTLHVSYIPYPLPGDVMLTSMESHRAHDTVALLQREMPEFIRQRCGHPIRHIRIQWTTAFGYPSREGQVHCLQIHDVKELKECLLREWGLLDHSIIVAAIEQWRFHLSACICVKGGRFEDKC